MECTSNARPSDVSCSPTVLKMRVVFTRATSIRFLLVGSSCFRAQYGSVDIITICNRMRPCYTGGRVIPSNKLPTRGREAKAFEPATEGVGPRSRCAHMFGAHSCSIILPKYIIMPGLRTVGVSLVQQINGEELHRGSRETRYGHGSRGPGPQPP